MERFASMGCEVVHAGARPASVRAIFARYDETFSRFRGDSELNAVNAQAGRVVRLSPLFAHALALAIELAEATDGIVDPTLGAAIEACGYDRDFALVCDDPRPCGAAAPGRFRELRLGGRLLLAPRGVRLDLNGVVKALAVDEAAETIAGEGFVSAGGDLAICGPLDVALPGGGAVRVLAGGLATSGRTRRSWRRGGGAQHHLIDPRTGRPSTSCWQEVTVSGGSCVAADAAAKAAFLLAVDATAWLDERGLAGRLVREDGTVVASRAWTSEAAACT